MSKDLRKNPARSDIRAVAKAAGVSISTVSRVINNSKPVSDTLRERVLRAVEKSNYVPNHTARSMVFRRTKTIGIVIPEVSAAFHSIALASIMNELGRTNRQALVCTVSDDWADEIRYLDLLSRGIADGVILMQETQNARIRTALSTITIPVVLASIEIDKLHFPSVGIDDMQAAFEATSHLISLGHRRIGLIAGSELTVGDYRTRGYRAALEKSGLSFDEGRIVHGVYSARSGYDAAKLIMERHADTTAIFAVSDEMAIGAMRYLKDMGKRIPEDISVIGFDDIDMAAFSDPPLSTVRQPIQEIGKQAAALLLSILEGHEPPRRRILLPYEIVARGSTGPRRTMRRS